MMRVEMRLKLMNGAIYFSINVEQSQLRIVISMDSTYKINAIQRYFYVNASADKDSSVKWRYSIKYF